MKGILGFCGDNEGLGFRPLKGINGKDGDEEGLGFRVEIGLKDLRFQLPLQMSLKGLYWEPQIGNPKNIAGI